MATPVANSVPLTGNPDIDALVQGGSWQLAADRVITYSLDLNFDGPVQAWTAAWEDAFARAFAAWSEVANIHVVLLGAPNQQVQNLSSADIAIALDPGVGQGAIAALGIFPDPAFADKFIASVGYSRTGGAYPIPRPEGDIVFDSSFPAFSNLQAGSLGYEIVLHETGHSLGLKHPEDDGGNGRPTRTTSGNESLMTSQAGLDNITVSQPMLLDIQAIQRIYGANTGFHAGNDVYSFSNLPRIIWDGGGTDTLDASGAASTATINLFAGRDSFIGATTTIAYGVNIENAIGSAQNDFLTGNDAGNVLDGRGGNDQMLGGKGDDTYIVDNPDDYIFENIGEGLDSVKASLSYSLGFELENLTLTGDQSINGTGNDYNNIITGNAGDNSLDGGGGADTLLGGLRDDTYLVDNPGDIAVENAGEGNDTVISRVTYTLGASIENLTLAGTDSINGTGNSLDNTLAGNNERNTLIGGAGNDFIDGGVGADSMAGGSGDDTYVVAQMDDYFGPTHLHMQGAPGATPVNGKTLHFTPSGGSFTIFLSDLTADGLVDRLFVSYVDNIGFTGNWFHLEIATNRLGQNLAPGSYENADRFSASAQPGLEVSGNGQGANQVFGRFTINAVDIDYTGASPVLTRFSVDFEQHSEFANAPAITGSFNFNYGGTAVTPEVVVENPGDGSDTVRSSIDYTLPDNVENLTLMGGGALVGSGNELNNVLTGNDANNVLTGGSGNDTLDGGAGTDTASFSAARLQATWRTTAGVTTVTSSDGIDRLTNIEFLNFSDQTVLIANALRQGNVTPVAGTHGLKYAGINEAFSLNIAALFSDADGDALTFDANGLPGGLSIDPASGLVSGTTPGTTGLHHITVTGTDPFGATANTSFDISVIIGNALAASVVTRGAMPLPGVIAHQIHTPTQGGVSDIVTDVGPNGQWGSTLPDGHLSLSFSRGVIDYLVGGVTKPITAADALDALKLSVGLPASKGSTWKELIAADIIHNGVVTAADALEILKVSVGISTIQPSWVFVPSDAAFNPNLSGMSRSAVTYKEDLNLASITSPSSATITGILVGDVNNSWVIPA